MSRKGTGPHIGLRRHGWQTHPSPSLAPSDLGGGATGDTTQDSVPAPGALPSAEHCEVVVNMVTRASSSPHPPILAQHTSQAKRKRTKVPGLRHHPPPACPAPAQPETQDKGLGQSEEDEGQRVEAAWLGHLWGPNWEGSKNEMAAKPSLHTHVTPQTFTRHLLYSPHPEHYTPSSSPTHLMHTLPHPLQHLQPSTPLTPHTLGSPETLHTLLTIHGNSSQGEKITESIRHTEKSHCSHTHTSHHTHTQPPTHTSSTPHSPLQAQTHIQLNSIHTHHPDMETHPA